MAKQITVKEYDYITANGIGDKAFEELKIFALCEQNWQFLRIGKGGIKAQNYVGVIQTKSGTVVEILPKIHNAESEDDTRDILVRMLSALKYDKYKNIDFANLKTSPNMPLLEVFISMFVDEVAALVQKGIRSDYTQKEENSAFLKGKLLFNEHLKQNLTHKERFFVSYDEYLPNRAENRLVKATLLLLAKKSKSAKNQQRLREYLFVFDEIEASKDFKADFAKCKNDRNMRYYERSLAWCRVFLTNEVFTPHKGESVAFALLFPMERVFEDYVAVWIKKRAKNWAISTQESTKYLVEKHGQTSKFKIKPDIVARNNGETIIADTKWKIIDANASEKNYQISQADMYQLFAYGKKYKAKTLRLIYPKNQNFQHSIHIKPFEYEENAMTLKVVAFDLKRYASK
jgi:5-methylcytosine-specific restriction enzyme subunit McrC